MSLPDFDSLEPRSAITEVVRRFGDAEKAVRDGFALVRQALQSLNESTTARDIDFDDPGEFVKELRRAQWRALVDRLQMQRAMSVKAWNEFDEKLRRGDPPPITVDILAGMVTAYRQDLPKMLEDSVVEMFDWLRPRDSEYRTNSEYEIGKRVILNHVVRHWMSTWAVDSYYEQRLVALENVFDLVAGVVRQEKAHWQSDLSVEMHKIPREQPCVGETSYFRFKGFKKGTLHIEFKRSDLVAKLNAIAGGRRLKPAPGSR